MSMSLFSLRLTEHQAGQLAYLTRLYGNQATAFRVAIDLLFTLRRLEELGIYEHLDTEKLRAALKDPAALPVK